MSQVINSIGAQELWEKLSGGEPCQIIDVREPDEYNLEHIAGAVSVPLSGFNDKPEELNKINGNANVYLLCRAGKRAQKAADFLSERGMQNLFVISGGLQAWVEAGCPTEQPAGR